MSAAAVAVAALVGAGAAPGSASPILDAEHGLATGWMDYGYSPHQIGKGAAARLDLANHGGLIVANPSLTGDFAALVFRFRAPAGTPEGFLQAQIGNGTFSGFPKVPVTGGRVGPDGFTEVALPMHALNPEGKRFDRIMLSARLALGHDPVLLDGLALTPASPLPVAPARAGRFELDCRAPSHQISRLIYGIGTYFDDEAPHQWATGATARRWGGDLSTRYNWEIDAWNLAKNWFFRNSIVGRREGISYRTFLDENRAHGVASALTVPILGWVAKDKHSYSFPVSSRGAQQAVAFDLPDDGNGFAPDGKPLPSPPPQQTSVPSTPQSIGRWVRTIVDADRGRDRSVAQYILDNEPASWSLTHRDVHPAPSTYDEILEKTIAYGTAVRRADPAAVIAGPAEWGWPAFFQSARDMIEGKGIYRPDRLAHGNVPLIPWYLRKLHEHEMATGVRVLDVLDVHFYPAAPLGQGGAGDTDRGTAALRIRSTRSLWDPTYVDESWINERMELLPLLRRWIDENYPGRGISIGEWNFGAEEHMSSGLAAAEALGRFGEAGITSAFYWTYPKDRSPAFWAFRAYRNFDGDGGAFLDWSLAARAPDRSASLFGSRDAERKHAVAVLLNFEPQTPLDAEIQLAGCGEVTSARAFSYAGGAKGFSSAAVSAEGGTVRVNAQPYSISVVDLRLKPER